VGSGETSGSYFMLDLSCDEDSRGAPSSVTASPPNTADQLQSATQWRWDHLGHVPTSIRALSAASACWAAPPTTPMHV